MTWTFTPYSIALMFMAGIVSTVSIVIWQRRHTPGGGALALPMMAAAIANRARENSLPQPTITLFEELPVRKVV